MVRFSRATSAHRAAIALIALFAVSLGLRVFAAQALQFDGLYGQDAYAYYSYGQQLREALAQFHLPSGFYFPLGYPALVALGFTITGQQPFSAQIVSLLAGAAVSIFALLLTMEIARKVLPSTPHRKRLARPAGIVTWAIVTVCGQLMQSSIVIMSDSAALMWAVMSAWALLVYGRSRQPAWLALTAFAFAFAIMSRWQYLGLALPLALYILLKRPVRLPHLAVAALVGLITLSPQIVHSLQNSNMPLGTPWSLSWSPANFVEHKFTTADGSFYFAQTPAEYYAQPFYSAYYMSPLFVPLVIAGAIILFRRKAIFALIVGWFAVQYLYLAGSPIENIRFALAIFLPLAVLAGVGTAWIFAVLQKSSTLKWIIRPAIVVIIVYGLLTTVNASVPIITNFVSIKNSDLKAAQWIEAEIAEPGATVYCLDLLLTIEHYTTLHPIQIYGLSPATLSDQLSKTRPAYAAFNIGTTEHQWFGKSPWIIYHWLLDNPGLTQIGTFGNYTLYRVGQ
ncbi:MAG: glycosyltransferase family 39 protein [Chloroflexota bacterium]